MIFLTNFSHILLLSGRSKIQLLPKLFIRQFKFKWMKSLLIKGLAPVKCACCRAKISARKRQQKSRLSADQTKTKYSHPTKICSAPKWVLISWNNLFWIQGYDFKIDRRAPKLLLTVRLAHQYSMEI